MTKSNKGENRKSSAQALSLGLLITIIIIIIICNQVLKTTANPMPTYKPKTSICSSVPNAPCWSFSLASPVVQAYHWHRAQVQPQYTAPRLDPKSQTQVHKRPWGPKPITVPFSSAPEITQFPTPTSTSLKGASSQKPSLQHFSPPPPAGSRPLTPQ